LAAKLLLCVTYQAFGEKNNWHRDGSTLQYKIIFSVTSWQIYLPQNCCCVQLIRHLTKRTIGIEMDLQLPCKKNYFQCCQLPDISATKTVAVCNLSGIWQREQLAWRWIYPAKKKYFQCCQLADISAAKLLLCVTYQAFGKENN
jgi:hypothetical protein